MYVVTVEFVVRPEHLGRFVPVLIANARASREEEPGCRRFDVCVDPRQPQSLFLYEIYDHREAFDAHVAAVHYRQFDLATADWVERKTVHHYDLLDPRG